MTWTLRSPSFGSGSFSNPMRTSVALPAWVGSIRAAAEAAASRSSRSFASNRFTSSGTAAFAIPPSLASELAARVASPSPPSFTARARIGTAPAALGGSNLGERECSISCGLGGSVGEHSPEFGDCGLRGLAHRDKATPGLVPHTLVGLPEPFD